MPSSTGYWRCRSSSRVPSGPSSARRSCASTRRSCRCTSTCSTRCTAPKWTACSSTASSATPSSPTPMSVVSVPVATLWSRPESVLSRDAPAVADRPDIPAWIAALTPAEQVDTPVVTQLLAGERVLVEEVRPDGWARVVALDQPADRLDPRGYPGWLRLAHLRPRPSGADVVEHAREYLGAVYVWGGLS